MPWFFLPDLSNFVQELPADATIKAIVKEKGRQHDAKGSWLSRVGQNLAAGAMLVEEAAMGRKGLGVPKAYTEAISLSPLLNKSHVDTEGFVEVRLPITKLASGPISAMGYGKAAEKGDFVTFRMRWLDFAALKRTWVGSDSLWEGDRCDSTSSYHFKCSSDKAAVYEPIGAKQVMKIERCQDILDTWKQYYGEDSLYDDLCDRCPTVKKLRAVHGVNVPTEAAYALRVQTIRLKQQKYWLDWHLMKLPAQIFMDTASRVELFMQMARAKPWVVTELFPCRVWRSVETGPRQVWIVSWPQYQA